MKQKLPIYVLYRAQLEPMRRYVAFAATSLREARVLAQDVGSQMILDLRADNRHDCYIVPYSDFGMAELREVTL